MVVYWIGRMKPTREVANLILFKNGPPQPLLSFIFGLFKQTSLQFLQQICMKHVHPVYSTGIRTHDLQNMSLIP